MLKSIIERTFIFFWQRIFHSDPSPQAQTQVKKFIIFGVGMLAARVFSTAAQIIMGRKLGPEVYGQLTMIILLSSYFSMPIVNGWGLVFIKIVSKEKEERKKRQALTSLLLVVFVSSLLVTTFLAVLQNYFVRLFNVTPQLMSLTLIMTIFYSWWILTKHIVQGREDWSAYVLIENIWALIVLFGVLGLFWGWYLADLVAVSYIFFLGYFFAGFCFSKKFFLALFEKIRLEYIRNILYQGYFLLLNGLVGMATFSIDRILINRTLGAEEVGVYQAHFLSTYGIISAFMTIILTYVFPIFCRSNNISELLGKFILFQYPITIFVSVTVGGFVLWMYSYPMSLGLFSSLCLFNAVQFHVQLKTYYLASKGANESKITFRSQLFFLVCNVLILVSLVQQLSILAGGISLLLAACASLAYLIKSEARLSHERTV
ncbi:MAG: oligosaccharide flippase family protein [Candidatus Electrothrix sp. GW3-4]|uniref:oligosaccharide flippase family protein n=1 Tax=Candidatus Electrothrix sp. GW3-4 TaxID=3126740 RepID=UPI0030D51AB1